MANTCIGKTKSGTPCGMTPTASGYCYSHDPARAAERIEARRRGGRHRKRRGTPQLDAGSVEVATIQGVQAVLAVALGDALRLDVGVARIKAIASLCDVALRALDRAGDGADMTQTAEELRAVLREMQDADIGAGLAYQPYTAQPVLPPDPAELPLCGHARCADVPNGGCCFNHGAAPGGRVSVRVLRQQAALEGVDLDAEGLEAYARRHGMRLVEDA
jgi:hypothetical protein